MPDVPSPDFWRALDHLADHHLIRVTWDKDRRSLAVWGRDDDTKEGPDRPPPVVRTYQLSGWQISVSDSVLPLVQCLLTTGAAFTKTRSDSINAAAALLWDHIEDNN